MRDGLGGVQNVAIIGGTSEIGLAIAGALDAERYVLAGRDSTAMREAAADLPISAVVEVDVSETAGHAAALRDLFQHGDLDVVVLAAGVLSSNTDPDEITDMALVNGAGSISLLARLAEQFRAQGHGHLVVLSSVAIVRPRPSNYWYGATKAGLDFAARGLAEELVGTGVTVTIVRPGFVHTRMTQGLRKAPFACQPEDVGRAVTNAVRNQTAGILWVPGILRWVALLLRGLPKSLLIRIDR